MTARKEAAEQALRRLEEMFARHRLPSDYQAIQEVDIITSKGTDEQVLLAFESIPARLSYQLPRMLLLRRLWQLGDRFINDEHYMDRFDRLKLLNVEVRKMVQQFGAPAVTRFRWPAVLRKSGHFKTSLPIGLVAA